MPVTATQPAITAIVICRNAADQLDRCLRTLRWADELLVVNLQSTDNTLEIASRWADRILSHCSDESVFNARNDAITRAKHDWIIIAKPQDQFTQTFERDLRALLSFEQATALLNIPRQFCVGQKPLDEVPMSMRHKMSLPVFCRSRCVVSMQPDDFLEACDGFDVQDWPDKLIKPVKHICQQSATLHFARIAEQAFARHQAGMHFTLLEVSVTPVRKIANVIGHFWQVRKNLRVMREMAFDMAVAWRVLLHQIRRTLRVAKPSDTSSDTAQRKAA